MSTDRFGAGTLETIIKENARGKFPGIFGENTVNVLMVNLEIAKELGLLG